jgi:hypothetical protein
VTHKKQLINPAHLFYRIEHATHAGDLDAGEARRMWDIYLRRGHLGIRIALDVLRARGVDLAAPLSIAEAAAAEALHTRYLSNIKAARAAFNATRRIGTRLDVYA